MILQPSLPLWIAYIESQIGFILPKTQHQWLINAILSVADRLNMTTDALYQRIRYDGVAYQALIDAVVIAETRFFRDKHSLSYIGELYDEHLQRQSVEPFSVLSVGCSTGQEVWSIAMLLDSRKQLHSKLIHDSKAVSDYEIMGIDVSQTSVGIAKTADYPARIKQEVPAIYQHYLTPIMLTEEMDVQTVGWHIHQKLHDKTSFACCNVFDNKAVKQLFEQHPTKRPKVIVCQNMLIYFRRFDQRDILDRLTSLLRQGDYLILGAAEAWFWQHQDMKKLSHATVNVWQKVVS